mmetsp:Transcript_32223/g.28550  ORF Transcript_32223/g.28550 Transcript_32223/m.28550 type:complete len:94 (-) Transcript_32223:732-1013(-)
MLTSENEESTQPEKESFITPKKKIKILLPQINFKVGSENEHKCYKSQRIEDTYGLLNELQQKIELENYKSPQESTRSKTSSLKDHSENERNSS